MSYISLPFKNNKKLEELQQSVMKPAGTAATYANRQPFVNPINTNTTQGASATKGTGSSLLGATGQVTGKVINNADVAQARAVSEVKDKYTPMVDNLNKQNQQAISNLGNTQNYVNNMTNNLNQATDLATSSAITKLKNAIAQKKQQYEGQIGQINAQTQGVIDMLSQQKTEGQQRYANSRADLAQQVKSAMALYDQQKAEALPQYQQARNDADFQADVSAKKLADAMAFEGRDRSGDFGTAQLGLQANRMTNINNITRDEQNFVNDIERRKGDLSAEEAKQLGLITQEEQNFYNDIARQTTDATRQSNAQIKAIQDAITLMANQSADEELAIKQANDAQRISELMKIYQQGDDRDFRVADMTMQQGQNSFNNQLNVAELMRALNNDQQSQANWQKQFDYQGDQDKLSQANWLQQFLESQRQFDKGQENWQTQFNADEAYRGKSFDEGVRQFDVGQQNWQKNFDADENRFNKQFGENQRQFNVGQQNWQTEFKADQDYKNKTFNENQRQFNIGQGNWQQDFGLKQSQYNAENARANRSLSLQEQEYDDRKLAAQAPKQLTQSEINSMKKGILDRINSVYMSDEVKDQYNETFDKNGKLISKEKSGTYKTGRKVLTAQDERDIATYFNNLEQSGYPKEVLRQAAAELNIKYVP